jgi:hypothetical protein
VIVGITATLITAAIFGRLLAWFIHKVWPTSFVDERDTTQFGAVMMIAAAPNRRLNCECQLKLSGCTTGDQTLDLSYTVAYQQSQERGATTC